MSELDNIVFSVGDDFPVDIGVYLILFTNSSNDKVYIGSTAKYCPDKKWDSGFNHRWKNHLCLLRKNKHHSIKLQNAYNKYGEQYICFIIIEKCSAELCIDREQFYIDKFNSYLKGYNCRPKADNMLGKKHTPQTKEKISKFKRQERDSIKDEVIKLFNANHNSKQVGQILNICHRRAVRILKENFIKVKKAADYRRIPVFQYDLLGNFICKYEGVSHCTRITNISESSIFKVLKGKRIHAAQFYFHTQLLSQNECKYLIDEIIGKYKESGRKFYIDIMPNPPRKRSNTRLPGDTSRARIKNIKQLNLDGSLVKIWNHSKEIVNYFKLKNATPILRVLSGERKTFKNYKWSL